MEEKIKKWYVQGLWTAAMVETAGKRGLLTPAQAEAITGKRGEDHDPDVQPES